MQFGSVVSLTLAVLLSAPITSFGDTLQSRSQRRNQKEQRNKIAPDLSALLQQDDQDVNATLSGKTLAEVRQARLKNRRELSNKTEKKLSAEMEQQKLFVEGQTLPTEVALPEDKQSFIVSFNAETPNVALQNQVAAIGGTIHRLHENFRLATIEAPRSAIRQLAAQGDVAYISPNRLVASTGHLAVTTGAAQIRALASSTSTTAPTYDGKGIGIAIIDSGIDTNHILLSKYTGHPSVVENESFVADGDALKDYLGHGSLVASIAAGGTTHQSGYYEGIAPAASLYSLRVLDDQGRGSISAVITALDWCIKHKSDYNIRVINLSLGAIAKDSYKNDPLCLAARRAVDAGIVVVAAAGNDGKDAIGRKVYGGIHSPGIDPSVLTVGSANTFGTDTRSDDVVTSYSSRGPTHGYTTDANGVRHYDNLVKPDLVAPGNKIIGEASTGQGTGFVNRNQLLSQYPALMAGKVDLNGLRMMYMSGTSVSTPVVSGAVALLLQAKPNLTPNLVKAILMYSAQPIQGANTLEQGAGLLNVDGAMRIASLVKNTLPKNLGDSLLTASLPNQQSFIAGENCIWGKGVITNWGFLYGNKLMTKWQGIYGSGLALADGTAIADNEFTIVKNRVTSGVGLYSGIARITGSGLALADGIILSDGLALADGIILSDGLALADGIILSDGMALADGLALADGTVRFDAFLLGDNTACMLPAP